MAQDIDWDKGAYSEPAGSEPDWDKGSYSEPPKPRTRGVFEAINDTVIEGANAAAGGVSAAANFFKPGNAVSEFIDENIIKAGEAKQSDVVRAEKKAMTQGIQEADGVGGELAAVGKYVVNNPVLAAAQAAGSFVMPGAAAKVLGRVGGIGAGAAMAGGDAAGAAYDLSKQAGATEDQAVSAGRQASVIPAAVGGVTGAFGAERILAGGKGFAGNAASRALKTGASEAGQEAIEEGVTAFEGQRAAMPYDATIDPTKGVAAAAGMGAVMGGAAGAGVSLLSGGSESAPTQATSTAQSAGAQAFAAGQPMTPPADIKSVAEKAQWVRDWQDAAAASMTTEPGAAGQAEDVTPSGDVLPEVPGSMAGVQRTFDPRAGGKPPISMLQTDAGGNAIDFEASPEFDRNFKEFPPLKENEPTRALGFNPLAGTPRVFPDGTVSLGSDQDEFTKFIPSRATQFKRSEQMGLNPAAGPMSAAAATAVDTGAYDQAQQQTAMAQAAEVAAQEAKKPAKKYAHRVNGTLNGKPFQTMVMAASTDEAMVAAVKASPGLQPASAEPVSKSATPTATPTATPGEPTNGTTPAQAVEAAPQGREAKPAAANLKPPRGILAKKAEADAARAARTPNGQTIQPATEAATDAGAVAPPAVRSAGVSGVDEQGAVPALSNVQNPQSRPAGAETQAAPVEASTPARGDAAQAAGVPATPGAGDVQADGVTNIDPVIARGGRRAGEYLAEKLAANPERAKRVEALRESVRKRLDESVAAIADAAHQAATSPKNDLPQPTEAQKEAGNYAKCHITINGLDITIENPAGSKRRPEWPPLKNHYGYFKGSIGADKDHVDLFMTDRAGDASLPVFVVDQTNRDGTFDEHKVIMGASDEAEASAAYLQNYEKGWTGLGAITQMTQDEFKAWVRDPSKTKKPVALKRGVLAKMAAKKQPKPETAAKAPPAEPVKPEPAPQPRVEKPAEDDAFMGVRKDDPKDLIITHNLTPENVMHAIRIGGIPVPSLAVTKKDNALSSFGSITLIGKKEMADPKGYAKPQVFGADIYSPRYPNVEYKIEGAALRSINEKLKPFLDGGREIYGGELSRLDDLTSNKAFKRFAADKLGEADQNAVGYHELKGVASALITESGAEERIFRGYTNSGNRKYIPHTLDNVVAILKKELRGGENFSYGVGSVRAKYTPKFNSIKDIRKGRDRLVTKEEFDAIKKEVDDEFFKIGEELSSFHGASKSFGYSDAVALMMSDAAKMGIPRALEENGFEDVSPDSMEIVRDYLNKLRTLPTEYFEAKILRPVALAEFAAAVVPERTNQAVIDAMRKEGITRIVTYKDDAERKEVTRKMAEELGDDAVFMGSKSKRSQGTTTDRAVMAMAAEGKSADEILRFIANASKSPFNRQMANLLRRTKANPTVSIGGEMGGGAGFKFLAKYSRKNHEVTLSEGASGKAEQILLHEMVHAATLLALDRGGEHAARMKALYESVKAQGLSDAYGMKNVGEFVAEAFTNPEFQKLLKGYKAPGGTAWDRFVAAVRRILGMSDKSQDALSAALELGVEVMRENVPLRKARSFSAEDAPEYFGMADAASLKNSALEQIKQFDVKTAPKNTWAHYRGMAMQALGRRQIVDLYAEELPQLEHYNDLVQRMDAEKNESGADADNLAQEWGKLKNGEDRTLAELMHDATLAQMDPSKAQEPGTLTIQYKSLEARYKALTPEARALFGKARDMYKAHYTAVQKAIKERIERSEMSDGQKRQIMAKMDEELFKELKGVYFPLARFGQYVIVVKDANGEVKNVTRSETVKEAEAARKELQKAFPAHMGNTVGKVLKQAEFNAGRDAVGKGFMADLMGALDKNGIDDELRDTVAQLYLSSLPDLSWAKHGIHRKGTPGFSQDARRAFAQNMFHGARYLAKLRYADQLQDQLTAMQDHIKAYESVEEYDSVEAQQVVDEMVKRHEFMMNPKSSPVSTALTSFGFLFHMGLSPASAMVNLTQTALVAFPQMGAKWGFGKASAALIKASEETVRAKNDLSKVLKGDELDALNKAINDGTIDVTMAHDLAGISQGEDQGVMWKVRPVMRAASFMFHHAEKFNRQATFLAAYRLAKEANPTRAFDRLYEDAQKATYDGHFDYGTTNRPRMMQGNWQRVILLFKTFAQNMIYTLARNAYQSIKAIDPKERTQARKALAGMLATHSAAAGVLGLPIVGQLLTIASFLGSDDDEPWDAEVAMQNAMAELLGPKAAEVMARGLSRLTPFDLSGRVALDKLILPDVQEGLEGKAWAESAMAAALGPVAGIGVNVARGMQKITDGDYMRGIEDMLPTALRGPIKALRYAQEGAVDKTGIVITDEVSAAGVIGQASGFSPSQVRRDTERRSAIYGYDRALLERRSVLMRMFADAQMAGDTETVQDVRQDIAAFNEKNPNRRITVPNLMQSVRNRQRRIDQSKEGVYLPAKRRDALDAVTF